MGRRTHCSKGHAFTPENTYVHTYRKSGVTKRWCKRCRANNSGKSYKANPIGDWSEAEVTRHRETDRRNRLKKYGITPEEYDEMFATQGGLCAICRQPERTKKKRLSVDHNHLTETIRALLCHHCNALLGHAFDDPGILANAAHYLRKHLQ